MRDETAGLRLGRHAAIAAAVFALVYDAMQLLEWLGLFGSTGGPSGVSTAAGIYLLLTPSLLLGPSFVIMCAALIELAAPGRRAHALGALGLAAVYAALTGLVYATQLTFVAPAIAAGRMGDLEVLRFVPYGSFLFAIDLWGYAIMCLAMALAALALPHTPTAAWTRRILAAHGLLVPFLALQMFVPAFIWPASLWAITFPAACLLLARLFGAEMRTGALAPGAYPTL